MRRVPKWVVFALGVLVVLLVGIWWHRRNLAQVHLLQAPDAPMGIPTAGEPYLKRSPAMMGAPAMGGGTFGAGGTSQGGLTLAVLAASQPERYLIKTATVTLEVRETKAAAERLTALIKENKGYVADLREWVDALGNQSATVTFRVPANRFEEVLTSVKSLGTPLDVQVSSEDVTEEYVDVEAQLRNLKRTEERLLGHLSRTGRLADTLAVERELSRVRQEIERLEGRLRYLSHRVAFCTVTVTLRQSARTQPLVPPEAFSTGKVASDAVRSLVGFAQSLWSLIIWLAVWAVIWLPLAIVGWVGYRRLRRV
jgi:hypothetical protein